jgi:hypothetical protein
VPRRLRTHCVPKGERQEGTAFAFAGHWEAWRALEDREWLLTCTIITCESNEGRRSWLCEFPVQAE